MGHKHTCLNCSQVIEQGEFDCERDADHDWAYCDRCGPEGEVENDMWETYQRLRERKE